MIACQTAADFFAPTAPELVFLAGGEFLMGALPDDKFADDTVRPVHHVNVAAFALGKFPVTVGEYRQFSPDHAPGDPAAWPVVNVSWDDAENFCAWLAANCGRVCRLPSESEWEFACRAGAQTSFACGNEITTHHANYFYNENGARVGAGRRTPVNVFPANTFGLHDMHGNVCEWCADTWHPNYHAAPADGGARVRADDSRRVIRGGAWDYLPRLLRSAWRDALPQDARRDNVGFRVACDV
jgi:formylglycine-generating enzyme required for sulfatase activity